jgi:5-methylcytosine-specific restriction endonuclease McrA
MNARTRELVWQRANSLCEYCQLPAEYSEFGFEIDHVIAEKHGGASSLDNLCLACFYCNSYKGPNISGVDPETAQIIPLYNPRQQNWNRHFEWNGPLLVGKTRSARAAIEVLNINDEFAVALRQSLIEERVFPPHATRSPNQ